MILKSVGLTTLLLVLLQSASFGQSPAVERPEYVTQRQYLSGTDADHTVPWEFFCTGGRNSGKWTTIPVPSCWELQGFGTFSYGKDDQKEPPEKGLYRHTFKTPTGWSEKRIFLNFVASMTDTEVKVNGQSAGPIHQGAFYTFKYDITQLLKPAGEDNLLEVTVSKLSARDSVNRAERQSDYWLFGGIFRPVYLLALPQQYIPWTAIDAKADGSFTVDVSTPANTTADDIEVEIRTADGKSVATAHAAPTGTFTRVATRVEAPATWTAETPNLYFALIRLKAGNTILHENMQRFGFRTIEVRAGDGVYVNGTRVMLKGVCRHSFWPDTGRTLSPRLNAADVELIKDMNMNAVRMSHYPPDPDFLALCDEKGLYVINELSGWHGSHDTENGAKLIEEMITRDVNHPSILFWDNGNEGGWNTKLDGEYAKWDPQKRAVLHPWALHDNVNTKHYPDYALLTKLLAGPDIVMPTEFQHALYDGGGGAGFRDYWDAMRKSKVGAGAFFWVLADEGVRRGDWEGRPGGMIDVQGNTAPDGVVGPYHEKEASFYTIKKIWSPVLLPERLPENFDGKLEIENTYDFTSLRGVTIAWKLVRWATPDASGGSEVIAEGKTGAPDVAPHQKGDLQLPLPPDFAKSDALSVTATDAGGRELWTWVWPIKKTWWTPPAGLHESRIDAEGVLTSDAVTIRFNASNAIESVTVKDKAIPFTGGPRLVLGTPTVKDAKVPTGKLTQVKWTPQSDGWFKVDYTYEATGASTFAGITFDLPETDVKSAKWLGDGPYRVWKNRLEGGNPGVWEAEYNNSVTGWSGWKYPEFKGYFANFRWAKLTMAEGSITIATETPGLFFRLLTPEFAPDKLPRTAMAPFPEGTISILHAIPAIGNKFQAAAKVGPQSEPAELEGTYSGVIWLRFQ